MMRSALVLAVAAGVLAVPSPATPATLKETFDAGVAAFRAGRYDEAAGAFSTLAERYGSTSPDVLANLGASEFLAGRPGRAILHLHRAAAARGTPAADLAAVSLERIRASLNQRQGEGARKGGFVFGRVSDAWTALFSWADPAWAGAAFLAAWAALFLVLAAWRLAAAAARAPLRSVAIALAVAAAASGTLAYGSHRVASYRVGVVLADGAGLYDALGSVEKALSLPEGLEVRVLDVRGGFVHVRLSSGRDGWVPEDALGIPL
jgi:hypothetical protein